MNDVKTNLTNLTNTIVKYIKDFQFTDGIARISAGIIGFLIFLLLSGVGETLMFIMAFPTMLCCGLVFGFIVFELFRHFNLIDEDITKQDTDKVVQNSKGADK